jgi:hypothetical protein
MLNDERAGLAALRDVLDFGTSKSEVDRDRDQPGSGERDVHLHPLDAVVRQQCDTIPLRQAQ